MADIAREVGGGVPVRTSTLLTKCEYARLVGLVSLRMSFNRSGYTGVDHTEHMTSVAEMAITRREIDAVIRRPLPDGTFEDCNLRALSMDGIQF